MQQNIERAKIYAGLLLAVLAGNTSASPTNTCYVTGDTSGNNVNKPLGSAKNPYGSLAAVEADLACDKIIVRWSEFALDGGIVLRPGQMLEGDRGPNGELPVLTNSSEFTNGGFGVTVAADNVIRHMHVLNTWASGVGGLYSGSLTIQKSRVSGSGQSGDFTTVPGLTNNAWPNVLVGAIADSQLSIKESSFGDSDGAAIWASVQNGFSDVLIDRVNVSNQGDLTADGFTASPGIFVLTEGPGSAHVEVRKTTVSDIGEGFSNSDGLLLINTGFGDYTAEISEYSYDNPDGDGGRSATGMEIGVLHALGGTFNATVKDSVIDGSNACGIQVVDLVTETGGNSVQVVLENNQITNSFIGVCGWQDDTPNSEFDLTLLDNQIHSSTLYGVFLFLFGPNLTYDAFLQGNSIIDSGDAGLLFVRQLHDAGSYKVDAGLGALGSEGNNRIINSGVDDVLSLGMDAAAANNWWGSPAGPASVVELEGAIVTVNPVLTEDPE